MTFVGDICQINFSEIFCDFRHLVISYWSFFHGVDLPTPCVDLPTRERERECGFIERMTGCVHFLTVSFFDEGNVM